MPGFLPQIITQNTPCSLQRLPCQSPTTYQLWNVYCSSLPCLVWRIGDLALVLILLSDVRSKIALRQVRETQRTLTLFYFMQGILKRFEVTILIITMWKIIQMVFLGPGPEEKKAWSGLTVFSCWWEAPQLQCLIFFSALCICQQGIFNKRAHRKVDQVLKHVLIY